MLMLLFTSARLAGLVGRDVHQQAVHQARRAAETQLEKLCTDSRHLDTNIICKGQGEVITVQFPYINAGFHLEEIGVT